MNMETPKRLETEAIAVLDPEPSPAPQIQAAKARGRFGQAGMTLLEILIVLAIITLVLGFLVGPRLMAMFGQSKEKLGRLMVNRLAEESFAQWQLDNSGKDCPTDIAELAKYSNDKAGKDPWGHQMVLLCGDSLPEGVRGIGVLSMGPDGKLDTQDDIKSWEDGKSE